MIELRCNLENIARANIENKNNENKKTDIQEILSPSSEK